MTKAFIFDMDGVIIDDESNWTKREKSLFKTIFGKDIASQIGNTVGVSSRLIFEKAKSLGFEGSKEATLRKWDEVAFEVYAQSAITPNVDLLVEYLLKNNLKIAIVSSSRMSWINKVLPRLSFKGSVEAIISLAEREDIEPKPSPEGYNEMIKTLGAVPDSTIILEDSNSGLKAARASGAYVISLSENLIPGYKQLDIADAKAKNMLEVIKETEKWLQDER